MIYFLALINMLIEKKIYLLVQIWGLVPHGALRQLHLLLIGQETVISFVLTEIAYQYVIKKIKINKK